MKLFQRYISDGNSEKKTFYIHEIRIYENPIIFSHTKGKINKNTNPQKPPFSPPPPSRDTHPRGAGKNMKYKFGRRARRSHYTHPLLAYPFKG